MDKIINVNDYGIIGDGITDCSIRLQRLIMSCNTVYLPPGDYKLNKHKREKQLQKAFKLTYPRKEK